MAAKSMLLPLALKGVGCEIWTNADEANLPEKKALQHAIADLLDGWKAIYEASPSHGSSALARHMNAALQERTGHKQVRIGAKNSTADWAGQQQLLR